jgi:hypothetical protein
MDLATPRPARSTAQRRRDDRAAAEDDSLDRLTGCSAFPPAASAGGDVQSPPATTQLADAPEPQWRWAWRRAALRTLPAPLRIFAFKLLHGALWTNAYHNAVHRRVPLADSRPFCQHHGCSGQLEGLMHAFMECPRAAPTIDWLLNVWLAVTGVRPPRDAALLLADCHDVWRPPSKELAELWTVLRLAVLHAIWTTRSTVAAGGDAAAPLPPPSAVVAMAVRCVRRLMQMDYTRVRSDVRALTSASSAWFAGRDPRMGLEQFMKRWAHNGVLCSVAGGELQVHLSAVHPASLVEED